MSGWLPEFKLKGFAAIREIAMAGEFAGVYITDTAAPSDYGDPVWCQWAADVVNGAG